MFRAALLSTIFCSLCPLLARGDQLTLEQGVEGYSGTDDNSIYEDRPDHTNGAHAYLYAGNTKVFSPRRALIRFDLSMIPAGSVINGAELQLVVQRRASQAFNEVHTIHRLTADWGEGNVNSSVVFPESDGGAGAPAELGDATWRSNHHGVSLWDSPGGDFVASASGSAIGGNVGTRMIFSDPAMAADAQHWVDHPAENFGWILRGNEVEPQVAYRLHSSEGTAGSRPRLIVDYSPPPPPVSAPVIAGLGDFVIGDLEDLAGGSGATISNNFIFPDAINLDFLVTDDLTPDGEIKWSFTGGNGRVLINGVGPLDSTLEGWNEDDPTSPRAANRIDLNDLDPGETDANPFTISLRNAELSPIGGPNLDPGVDGVITTQTATLTLFASDCTTYSARTIVVYTAAQTSDGISGSAAEFILGEDFRLVGTSTGWIGGTMPGSSGSIEAGPDGLCMTDPSKTIDDLLWISPEGYLDLVDGRIYWARARLSTDQTLPDQIPLFFFIFDNFYGAGSGNNYGGFSWVFDVDGGAQGIGRPQGRELYDFWLAPNAVAAPHWSQGAFTPQADAANDPRIMFRIIDSNALSPEDAGTICIATVEISGIARSDLALESVVYDPPIRNSTHFVSNDFADPGTSASIDDQAQTANISMGTMGDVRVSLIPYDPLADGVPGEQLGYAEFYPVAWLGDTLYRTRSLIRNAASETDPIDSIFIATDVANSELGAFSYTTRGAYPDWTDRLASPKLEAQEYEVYFYSQNATASVVPETNRLRGMSFFFNADFLAGPGTGGDALAVHTLEVDRLLAP